MIWFLDTSILAKRYVIEPGSDAVRELFRLKRRFGASALAAVEIRSALFRRVGEQQLERSMAVAIATSVDDDLRRMIVVQPRQRTVTLASALVERRGLRAYDAVQLASALMVVASHGEALTFGCADDTLRQAALAEGLRIWPARSTW